jgi:general stress protein 26
MSTPEELEVKFWKALKSDMTVMLGLAGVEEGHTRPMTAQVEDDRNPIWFFCSTDSSLVRALGLADRAVCTFASKNHDLFASVHGFLHVDLDRAVIDRLWNPFIAAWYDGKDDPKLVLLRFDTETAEVWLDASSLLAGIKLLFGVDPRKSYDDKVGVVNLG